MKKPNVENKKLQAIIEELWTSNPNPIGDGSVVDAVRHELNTGKPVGGYFHSKKAQDYIKTLENWLRIKTSPKPNTDKKIAREIIQDLKNALKGQ